MASLQVLILLVVRLRVSSSWFLLVVKVSDGLILRTKEGRAESLMISLFLSVSVYVSVSVCLPLCLSLSFSLSRSLSLSLFFAPSLSPSLPPLIGTEKLH